MEHSCSPPLLTLLSIQYSAVRKRCETLWNQYNRINLSASEWYVLSCIAGNHPSISEIARQAEISRQAAHKSIHTLLQKGLVQNVENGTGRGKRVALTSSGTQCLVQYHELQRQLEDDISVTLGAKHMHELKLILQQNWFE